MRQQYLDSNSSKYWNLHSNNILLHCILVYKLWRRCDLIEEWTGRWNSGIVWQFAQWDLINTCLRLECFPSLKLCRQWDIPRWSRKYECLLAFTVCQGVPEQPRSTGSNAAVLLASFGWSLASIWSTDLWPVLPGCSSPFWSYAFWNSGSSWRPGVFLCASFMFMSKVSKDSTVSLIHSICLTNPGLVLNQDFSLCFTEFVYLSVAYGLISPLCQNIKKRRENWSF